MQYHGERIVIFTYTNSYLCRVTLFGGVMSDNDNRKDWWAILRRNILELALFLIFLYELYVLFKPIYQSLFH